VGGIAVVAVAGLGLSSTSTSPSSAPVTSAQKATVIRKAVPTTRLGNLTKFATIVGDVRAKVARNDLAGGKTRVKDLEVSWDDAEAGLKPRDSAKWHRLDGEIDDVLTALRAGNPSQADCATAVKTLADTLDQYDGV
jgi:hypothetical protein